MSNESTTPSTQDDEAQNVLPEQLIILPIFERPFLPAQNLPIFVDELPWLETLKMIGDTSKHIAGLVLIKDPIDRDDTLKPEHFHTIGTAIRVIKPAQMDDKIQFIAEGLKRFKIVSWNTQVIPYVVQVEYIEDEDLDDHVELKAYAMAIIKIIKELVPLSPLFSEELKLGMDRFTPNHPSYLADFAAGLTTTPKEELQTVLEMVSVPKRMKKVLQLIRKELEVAKLQTKISERVEDTIDDQQRTFFLKEQLKAIQQELGISKDDRVADAEEFRNKIKSLTLSKQAQKRVDEELKKLSYLESGSPEYSVIRSYLDWITSLPWGISSTDRFNLKQAKATLDQDHDGLNDVKDRILEFIAVGKLKKNIGGSILLLIGPPGVGKTSIGRSIASALNREFFRFSVGGMRDEAEIKGHRRTYIGAMPGKLIQALKEVQVSNPVVMLDEIDKTGSSYQGDPASALLEVLDPEQNKEFLDHYLDIRFDLSNILFICTANQLDTIPKPLIDRMEVIRLSGYITEEKLKIAKNHLWPKQLNNACIESKKLRITDAAMRQVIEDYARESGVRNLEKQLAKITRKAAVNIVNGRRKPISITKANLTDYLGQAFFVNEKPLLGLGVITGLAWTAMGGATLTIEATIVHKNQKGLKLTGQLGDVMKESAEIAFSYISAHCEDFGATADFFDKRFVHLHVPAGATPKDGPSAGITMAIALLSLAKDHKIKRLLAMTGELTLTGYVFPVGGIREKVIAARRVKIHELIVPFENKNDVEELPDFIKHGITFHFPKHFKDVYNIVFNETSGTA